ncbi:unnamed protein product [Cuscuta europaea]|uniref:Uncharacterized protein n=1 Tax=Cuscuta europaea TaxID=41803 RepID=A0A9P0ZQR3_CUSEU|nr:unnamed protein product [Cuscuta europaea]
MEDQPAKGARKILNSEERTKGVQIETEIALATAGVSANVPRIVGLGILDKPGSSSMIPERLVAKNLLVLEMQDSRVEPNWVTKPWTTLFSMVIGDASMEVLQKME